jgi:hypothetical protein
MDKSAEIKVTIPRVDNGTESISFVESRLENTTADKRAENPWNMCHKKKLKNKMVGDMRTNAYNVYA